MFLLCRETVGSSATIPLTSITNIADSGSSGISVDTLVVYPVGTGGVALSFAQQLNGSPPDWLSAAYASATVSGVDFSDNGPEPPPLPPSPR